MCSPSMIVMGIGAGVSAYGQVRAGNARGDAAMFNASITDANQEISNVLAADAIMRGQADVETHRLQAARLKSEQQVAFAAGGVTIDTGSPLDVFQDTAALAAYDEEVILANAEREAYGHKVDAYNASLEGRLLRRQAEDEVTGGRLAALGSIAGGVGRMV